MLVFLLAYLAFRLSGGHGWQPVAVAVVVAYLANACRKLGVIAKACVDARKEEG
jgi:hypothetical protein